MISAPTSRKVTIRDLARELGVSDRTVSQALNPRVSNVRVNPQTAERIRLHAQSRNYRLDTSARAIRTGRLLNIGYFEAKQFPNDLPLRGAVEGVNDIASKSGYRVVLIKVPPETEPGTNPIPFVFREAHLDALIVANLGHLSPECKTAIDASGLPVVYLNEKKTRNAVWVNDLSGSRTITRHLIDRGCRRIIFLGTSSTRPSDSRFEHHSFRDRIRGYREILEKAGLLPEVLTLDRAVWQAELGLWLKNNPDVDAIMCPGDLSALRMFQIFYRNGTAVPEDILITGYGDDFAEECPVPVTTMRIPFYEMGAAAAEMAIRLLDEPPGSTVPSLIFVPEFVERNSTSRPGFVPVADSPVPLIPSVALVD